MNVTKLGKEHFLEDIQEYRSFFHSKKAHDICVELNTLEQCLRQKGGPCGYDISANEDEIDLLVPYLHMLTRDHASLMLVVLGGRLSLSALGSLESVIRWSLKGVIAPLVETKTPICVMLLPLAQQFQELLALEVVQCVLQEKVNE